MEMHLCLILEGGRAGQLLLNCLEEYPDRMQNSFHEKLFLRQKVSKQCGRSTEESCNRNYVEKLLALNFFDMSLSDSLNDIDLYLSVKDILLGLYSIFEILHKREKS